MSNDPGSSSSDSRRGFFRQVAVFGIEAVEKSTEPLREKLGSFIGPTEPDSPQTPAQPPGVRYLRPPGAQPGEAFGETCEGCSRCVDACPVDCIVINENVEGGLPFIVARAQGCVVCDDLACMDACPTGALQPTPREQIHLGLAVMDHEQCLRTGPDAEDCTLCVERCPMGETALRIDDDGLVEVRDGCVGCGECEHACPTEPAAITVDGPAPTDPIMMD